MSTSHSAQPLEYARPIDSDAARVEEAEDGPILVLPAESVASTWFALVNGSAMMLAGTAWAVAVSVGWVHPESSASWRARQMFVPGIVIVVGSLGAASAAFGLRARRRGQVTQPRLSLLRAGSHTGRLPNSVVRSVEVRRLRFPWVLRPRWALQITYGRSVWTWSRHYHTVGTDRLHAERLAAELRRLLGLNDLG